MRSTRRALAALLPVVPVLGTAVGGLLLCAFGLAAPAVAAGKPCVGVLVDGRLAGGDVRTACATGDPGSGLAALTKAGFSYAFVPRQPGQVCQIGGLPECGDTSTETYWSYWWRAKGSSHWVYATEGAGTHDPEPGDTEAWVWQDGGRRRPPDVSFRTICPQATQQHTQAATATHSPTPAATRKTAQKGTAAPAHPAARSSTPPATTPTSPPTSAPASSAAASSATGATGATGAPASTTAAAPGTGPATSPATSGRADDGPPWGGFALGVLAIGALVLATLTRNLRNRRP